jgi:hypothetical protein
METRAEIERIYLLFAVCCLPFPVCVCVCVSVDAGADIDCGFW